MASPLDVLGTGARALGEGIGSVAAIPFQFLGGLLGQGQPNATGWKHPDRQALALSYIPEALNDEDRAQRMEMVEKLDLNIIKSDDGWWVHESPHICDYYGATDYGVYDKDLRRAICLCVAKMMENK